MSKKECGDCIHITTPKKQQCYTLRRELKERVIDKGLPFFPEYVIPEMDNIANTCQRYRKV